mmetsp:Transcript_22678/g.34968  ORF Transcript_22678/g.34968 Transcript_22678/m.34968 type:complete len:115 (+) Transcript_22678:120-464(+)
MFSENEEENKHEYASIHEAYIFLVDQAIEGTINIEFGEERVEAFYRDFVQNYGKYKGLNDNTVDILKNATDFEKFKHQMVEMKKTLANEKQDNDIEGASDITQADNESITSLFW